jgi:hypothetical protein
LVLCIALFIAVHDLFIAKVLCIGFVGVTAVSRMLPCFVRHLPCCCASPTMRLCIVVSSVIVIHVLILQILCL